MAYIDFTDAIGRAFLKSAYPQPGDRFASWTPNTTPFGDSVSRLADSALVMFKMRDDYTASFDIVGIPIGRIAAPGSLQAVGSTTGGTLAAGDHYYVVTSMGPGESLVSNEVHVVTTGATSSVALTWVPNTIASAVRVYRGSTPGGESVALATLGGASYTDTGTAGSALTPPATGTSGVTIADRLRAHLLAGGTCSVFTQDVQANAYATCGLAPGATPSLRLTDRRTLEYTLSLSLVNLAGSPVRMECLYL